MEILKLIKDRYSTVLFSSEPVENEKLSLLFEAARWAPSAFNEQPWRFIIGIKGNDEKYEKLLTCLVEDNKYWAKYAPVLVLVVAKKNYTHNSLTNSSAMYDAGLAVGNLLVQATRSGLFVHQMGGYNREIARNEFNIPVNYSPIAVMAIGYKGNSEDFPKELQDREKRIRIRKPYNDMFEFD